MTGEVVSAAIQVAELIGIGTVAGLVGGLLGVGGGLVMIPAMWWLLGNHYGVDSFHLYKLAAITTSIVVSIPAAIRHARARAIVRELVYSALPLSAVGVGIGAAIAFGLSGPHTATLKRLFGGFLELVVAFNLYQGWRNSRDDTALRDTCPMPNRRTLVGAVVGLPSGIIAGLLGIAGGVWAVPAQHLLFGVRLRNAIANSTTMIVVVASVAAAVQSVAVSRMAGLHPVDGWWLTLWLAPGAVIGGWCGAGLTHRLSTRWLRHIFHAFLVVSGARLLMAG